MPRTWTQALVALGLAFGLSVTAVRAADPSSGAGLKPGNPDLKSAGPLAFGPDGILFVGDSQGAALFAIDTRDHAKGDSSKSKVEVKDLSGKIAAMLGTKPQQILINDLAVNPLSGNIYASVSRGRGPDAAPLIVKITADGKIAELSLENVPFAKTDVPNPPSVDAKARGESLRSQSITDLAYVDGRVFLAGLSNEEFSSRLSAIPFPFTEGFDGAAIEIYHGAHGRFETKSPVRTFVAHRFKNDAYLLAAYTCTPLVKVPVADLKAGAHIKGTTIAELGNRNRPLDMIVYQKDGKDYLLLTNSARGVMKIPTDGAATAEGIVDRVDGTKGLGYETIASLKGVVQLDKLDNTHAVILTQAQDGSLDLSTIDLP